LRVGNGDDRRIGTRADDDLRALTVERREKWSG
jgi:hypothetical protein